MKSNCKALKTSIAICSISFAFIIVTYLFFPYESQLYNTILNIFIGIFGSGLVSLLISIPAYRVSKIKLLEDYWNELHRLIRVVDSIDYLFCYYNDDVLTNYLNEIKNKEFYDELKKTMKLKLNTKEGFYKKELINTFLKDHVKSKIENKDLEKIDEIIIDNEINAIRKRLIIVCKEYIEVSKESTLKLNVLLGDMCFFTGKKPYNQIYENTYMSMYNLFYRIYEECVHIKPFIDGKGNEAIVLSKVLNLQKELFNLEIKEDKISKEYTIKHTFVNNMLDNLEELRVLIQGGKKEKQTYIIESVVHFKGELSNYLKAKSISNKKKINKQKYK